MLAWQLARATWLRFVQRDGPLLSAAVAFYALLAVAPLIVIAVVLVGALFGEDTARGELRRELAQVLGADGASFVTRQVEQLKRSAASGTATVLSIGFLVYAATRLFSALHRALNQVWGIRVRPGAHYGLRGKALLLLRKRVEAFSMVLLFAAAVLVQLVARTALAAADDVIPRLSWLNDGVELAVSGASYVVMIVLIYRVLPDASIRWGAALLGAVVTTVLLIAGSYAVGLYLGRASPESAYGAAGTVVFLLLWVYYNAQIFFLGAAFTSLYAQERGGGVEPLAHAVAVD